MNTRRQTIWLVSMLSLMVILSAYYLFSSGTDNLNDVAKQYEQAGGDQVKIDISESDMPTENPVTDQGLTEDEIIQRATAQAQSGEDYFFQQMMDRHEKLAAEVDRLLSITADATQTQEAVGQAENDLRRLDETNAKVEQIESVLSKDYPNAILSQGDDGRWKVTVQANKLEKKQAVEIFNLVLKELNIGNEKFAGVQIVQ